MDDILAEIEELQSDMKELSKKWKRNNLMDKDVFPFLWIMVLKQVLRPYQRNEVVQLWQLMIVCYALTHIGPMMTAAKKLVS